jgi:hypothetical protein
LVATYNREIAVSINLVTKKVSYKSNNLQCLAVSLVAKFFSEAKAGSEAEVLA